MSVSKMSLLLFPLLRMKDLLISLGFPRFLVMFPVRNSLHSFEFVASYECVRFNDELQREDDILPESGKHALTWNREILLPIHVKGNWASSTRQIRVGLSWFKWTSKSHISVFLQYWATYWISSSDNSQVDRYRRNQCFHWTYDAQPGQ